VGLAATRHISRLRIHPTNPDIVYVAAKGDMFGPNEERGVYRTRDGGETWEQVLYKNDLAGAVDLTMDPSNPDVLIASLNYHVRYPWDEVSGGPDTGIYKTTDGGETWTDLTRNPGMPEGVVGKIGVAISPPQPDRVYAIVEAADGGLHRSDDGGATWQKVSDERSRRLFPASYHHVTADPQDPDVVYVQHMAMWKSTDGGRTFTNPPMGHSDHHAMWIDPGNSLRIIDGGDGGAAVTLNGGISWSTLNNQPTADLFSLAIDDQDPYWLYASQNDNSHIGVPSRVPGSAISWPDYLFINAGEGGQTAVKPDGSVIYAADRTAMVRFDRKTGQAPDISVWPEDEFGAPVKDVKYRIYYSFPVLLSPHDPGVLYTAGQYLFRTTDEGDSWHQISPDLTRNRQDKMQKVTGGPITSMASSLYYVSLIRAIAESPREEGELWVGTDDSTVQLSRDGGATWEDISPPDLPEWTTITAIDVSPHRPGVAYLAGERHRVSDRTPYLYKTTDYGATWERITDGIGENDFTYVIREDPVRPGLLFAGTETGAYVSLDAGSSWQSLQRNLPAVAVMFMQVKNNDLVIATHGRGFWIMDNISALRQMTPEVAAAPAHLFEVATTTRRLDGRSGQASTPRPMLQFTRASGMIVSYQDREGPDGRVRRTYMDAGENPPSGVMIEYYLQGIPAGEVTLWVLDPAGQEIRRFSSTSEREGGLPVDAGVNRFIWDMRYPTADAPTSGPMLTGFEATRPSPPVAPPGRYAVHLTVDGETWEQPFTIRRDPRVPTTDAELNAQFELMLRIRDRISEVSDALDKLHEAQRRLEGSETASPALERLRAIEGQLIRLTGSHSLELGPKGLYNKLGTLSRKVVSGDAGPTRQMYDLFDDLSARLAEQLRLLHELIGNGPSGVEGAGAP
jgi:photosystem II stability/assembly factor-like uncharacterized protein